MVIDFSLNLNNEGKATINSINVIPSLDTTLTPSDEESKRVKPMNVVTQAQKKNNKRIKKEIQKFMKLLERKKTKK